MAAPNPIVRKKRNFKALALDVTTSASPPPPQPAPIPTRLAPPAGGARKKPPAMDLSKSKARDPAPTPKVDTASPGLLTISASPGSAPATGNRSNYHHHLSEQIATLDMNSEKRLDLKNEDLKELAELGQGNGGSVKKVEHVPTGIIMAKKVGTRSPMSLHPEPIVLLDRPHRRQALRSKANTARAANHARLSFRLHYFFLWCFRLGPKHLYLHGVHGQRVA